MTSKWFDDSLGDGFLFGDEELESFYCPYTNGSKCAVLERGWQVQELCQALECEQIKFAQHHKRRRREAA
jgi:hypothetical protein